MSPWLTVIGIGEDGFKGLGRNARHALLRASRIIGGQRQLDLLPVCIRGERQLWPSPFSLEPVLARHGEPVCVLASGDPMFYGVGASLARQVPAEELLILPAPSSVSLAAARLGWPLQDVMTLSVVARPLAALNAHLASGVRLLVLSNDGQSPAAIAALLVESGFGPSRLSVFEHLGGAHEQRIDGVAHDWPHASVADLNLVAIDCLADANTPRLSRLAGLPDTAFKHDGQLTKHDVRAMTLPGLQLVRGTAPAALGGLETPDAIFIGGGVTRDGVLDTCWQHLRPGGRLVANAVTLQSEMTLMAWRAQHGGELTRIHVAQAQPLGEFDTWRQALPITLLDVIKPL